MRGEFSVDRWLRARYDEKTYTCLHFTRDVWLDLMGEDIRDRLRFFNDPVDDRRIRPSDLKAFRRLAKPEEPCIAFLRRPHGDPHIGVYLRRRILHLRGRGAIFQLPRLAALRYDEVRYYR